MSDRFGGVPVDEDKFGGIAVAEPPEPTAQPSAPVPESTVREWLGDEGFPVPRTPEELGQQTFRRQQQLFGAVPPQPGEQETRPPLSTALELIGKGAVAIADLPSTIRNKLYPGLDPLPSIADLPRPQIPRVSPEEVSPTEPAAQTIAGLYNLAAGTVQELLPPFARPEVGLTLPLLGEGGMIAKVAAGLFGIEQLQAMPEEVREAIRVVKDPNSTLAQKVEAVGRPPVSGALATMMLKAPFKDTSGFAPAEREADARMRGISPVIADVQAREAASPAFAQWISQLTPEELRARGLPPGAVTFTAPGPLPSEEQIMAPQRATEAEAEAARVAQVRKFAEQVQGLAKPPRATVPGTPAEQRTTIAEEIRAAKADTVEKIRALFEPVTGPMKKSVARAWGREAWGQDWTKKTTTATPEAPPSPIELFRRALADPNYKLSNKLSRSTGLALKSVADLDALLDLFKQHQTDATAAKAKGDLNGFSRSAFKFQLAREAIETATNVGSWSEKAMPIGARPLEWSTKPEVADWLRKNGEALGILLPDELKPKPTPTATEAPEKKPTEQPGLPKPPPQPPTEPPTPPGQPSPPKPKVPPTGETPVGQKPKHFDDNGRDEAINRLKQKKPPQPPKGAAALDEVAAREYRSESDVHGAEPADAPERIVGAAVKFPNGNIYSAPLHYQALHKAWPAGESIEAVYEDGFITSKGRFVDRTAAYTIAMRAKQMPESADYPRLESHTFQHEQKKRIREQGAAPEEEGLQGARARKELFPEPPAEDPLYEGQTLSDLTHIGGNLVESGIIGYPEWHKAMTETVGPQFQHYFRRAYNQVRDTSELRAMTKTMTPRDEVETYNDAGVKVGAGAKHRPGLRWIDEDATPIPDIFIKQGDFIGPEGDYLDQTQRLAINLALTARAKGKQAILIADGPGVGKSGTGAAIGHLITKLSNKKVLIVGVNESQIETGFKPDFEKLGIPLDNIEFITYKLLEDEGGAPTSERGKQYARILATDYGAVIFDEAHSLKNAASNREHNSRKIKADFRVLMTATPMDNTANAIYFLSHITGKAPRQVMDELGLKIVEKMKGGELREFVVQKEGISHEDVSKATRKMREKAVADGTMIRREFPFFGEAKEHTGQRLTPEQLKQQQAIYDFWQEKIDRATFPTARMNYAGQRTHELARWSESMKGPEILKMIEDELAAGRSVVVYGNHINESLIKGLFEYNGDKPFMAPGILGWLSEELKKKNIEFAQIFGPVKDTKQQSIRAFYRNRVRVALVTPKSGGAGLNLDDVVGRYPRTLLTASMTWEGDIFEQLVYRVSRRNTASASKALFHMTPDAFADMRKRSGMDRKLNILRGMQAGEDTDLKTFIDDLNNPAEGPKLQGAAAEDWGGGHEKFQGAIEAGYDSGPKYSGLPYEYLADEIATQEALGNKVAADQLRSEKLRRDELDERAQAILDQDPDFLRYSELLETMPLDHPQRLDWERNRDKIVASVAQQVERTPPEPQGATAPPTVVPPSVAPAANKLPPKPLWQIVRDLKDGIAQPIVYSLRYSRFGGIFDPVRKYIRIKKPGDFPVVPHEVGHSIDNVFALSSMPALVPELDTLGDPSRPGSRSSWKPGKTVTYKMGEGAAEFMRLWITDPAEATRIAPNIERVWNAILDANPELEFMRTAREDYQVWKKSPAEARFESRISRGSNPLKVKWGVGNLVADGIDDLHFINQMVFDAISGGQPLRSGKDPYILFRNLRGSYGRAEIFLLKGTTDALTLDVTPGLSLLSVLRMVSGETNEWSRWLLAKNADMMRRQGKDPGIPPDEISAVLQAHNGKRNFHDAFNRLQQWNDSLLKYSVDLGYLTLKDLALMKKANEFYVPMHRLYEVAAGEPLVGGAGRGRAQAVIGRPGALRRRGGSDRPIIDPIEVLMRNAYEIVYAAEKNQALTALVDLSTRPGMGKWIRPEPMVQEPVKFDIARIREQLIGLGIDPKDIPDHALLEYWRETRSPRLPDNMIRVKRNGKWEYYQLEPNLYKAVQASDQFMMSNLWRWMAFPSQVLRAGVTGDPAFALWRNVLRDTVSASVISRYTILPFESSLRGAYNLLAPNIAELLGFKNHADLLEATVNEWKASGGKHSVESAYFDRDALIKFMQHAMTHDLSFAQRGLYLMKTPLMGLRLLSQIGEESTRIGEYKKVFDAEIAKGASRRDAHLTAAFEARDLQDFAMQGAKIKAIKLLTAFWNASLQGRYRFYRSWYDPRHPGIWQSTLLKGIGFITAAKMLEQYVNWDNDDYWNQPRWQRLMFFHFPIIKDNRGHWRFLLVPVPFEAGVIFASFPGAMMEYIKKRDPGIAKVFGQQFLYQTFDSPLPQFTTTLFEINAGEQGWDTFTGHPIVPTGETRQPYWARYTDQSSIVARRVGKMLNVAPAKIEHLIRRTTGGVGSQLVHQGVDKVLASTLGDKPAPLPATPFTSFVTTPAGARSQILDDFYAKLKVLELEKYSRDHLNKSDPEIELSDYPGMIAAQKQISDLRRQTFGELDADKRQRITLQMQAIAKPYVRTQQGKWKGWIIRRQQYP